MIPRHYIRASLIVTFALLAGMIGGGLVIWALLVKNLFGFAYGYPFLSPDIEDRPITIVQPKEVTLEFDVAVENILADVKKSSALIFTKRLPATTVLEGSYLASEAVGQATAITGDGWFMTSYPVKLSSVVYIPAINGGKAYTVEEVIEDSHSDTSFFKVTTNQEVNIASFAVMEELNLGETVVVVDAHGNASLGALLSLYPPIARDELLRSSDDPVYRPSFAIPDGVITDTAHIYDTTGRLIAIADRDGRFFNTDWIDILPQVLRGDVITRQFLGVHYVLISDLISESKTGIPDVRDGAWILGNAVKPPVIKNSPADEAGFSEGEIITAVERELVTRAKDLEMLLSQYNAGQTVTIRVITNDGREEERSVTLGSY